MVFIYLPVEATIKSSNYVLFTVNDLVFGILMELSDKAFLIKF